MLKAPKSLVAAMTRKIIALMVAYSFLATSVWSVTLPLPIANLRGGNSTYPMNWGTMRSALANTMPAALVASARNYDPASGSLPASSPSPVFTNFAELTAAPTASAVMPIVGGATVNFFGPQQYVRTTGPPNTYTTTIQVPAGVGSPFNLHIQNGEADGFNRVSSATITINNVQVAGPSDFNQNVFTIDRAVTLIPTTTLVVTLASKPGSYLRINLSGANSDGTPPVLTIAAPLNGSAINTLQAHIAIQYQDTSGPGEPAASGVDTATLQVLLDGTDRTSLFTKRSGDATADLPASLALAQGPHTLSALIKDFAGNTTQATSQFQVDTTAPALRIVQPASGTYSNNVNALVQIAYSDNLNVNVASLKVTINGVDQSAQFAKTATGASASTTLPPGSNSVVATISDLAGNQGSDSSNFNIDTTAPTIGILHPLTASVQGPGDVEFSVQFSDDQAIDPGSVRVSVDGTAVAFTTAAASVSGSVALADGNHNLTASVKDKAGNQGSASAPFSVDTTAPDIHIEQPASGAILSNPTPAVLIQVGSNLDLDPATFRVNIDGTDATASFPLNGLKASGTAPRLADGAHTITAQIAKVTGKTGQAQIGLVIDTLPPQVTIDPLGFTNSAKPEAVVRYSDAGSGVNLSTLHVLVDGADVTSGFSAGASTAQGVLSSGSGLAEGPHTIQVSIADKAGNVGASASVSFTVDFTSPTATFTTPANNSFINTTQPAFTLTYSDSGSGIDASSIHIFLQPANQAETEITSLFTVGASQATGVLSSSGALSAGTYHLRAQVRDRAGNQSAPTSAFAVDITPPTYTIVSPAANAFLKTATPDLLITYQDDSSGVDLSKFALRVDGIDQTRSVTAIATGASGTLPGLADGTHHVEVTVVDRAGNIASVIPQSFLVDTIAPTLNISSPAPGILTNNSRLPIAISYADSGSGIDVSTLKVLIDGVDNTAAFTATGAAATGAVATALADGPHTIAVSISDLAGNPATATTSLTVDTIPPLLTITQPADGGFTNATNIVVVGTVVDASPVTVTVEGTVAPVQGTNFTSAGIALNQGAVQVIHVVATDAAGNSTPATAKVNIDRAAPTISGSIIPAPNAAGWNNGNVTVSFICTDDASGVASCPDPVNVTTEGANQVVTGKATDRAGNSSDPTSVTVKIDKTPPVLAATSAPVPNAAGWNTSDVTITYVCSDSLSGIAEGSCPLPKVVNTEGTAQQITASVSDVAGNRTPAVVTLSIEKTAPSIAASMNPAPNAAAWNNTEVTVNFSCSSSASVIVACSPPVLVTTEGKAQIITGNVTDQAGKMASASATVNLDKTAPQVTGSLTPPPNTAGWNNTDVIVNYSCTDSLSGIATCPPPTTVSTEGLAQQITGQATDIAGNTASVNTSLNIDRTPPTINVSSSPSPNATGWNNNDVTVSYSCDDNLSGVVSCPSPSVVTTENQNQPVSAQITDKAGNVATGTINISIDKTKPTIVQLSTPDHISRLHPGQIMVTANDNFTVTQVIISVNGSPLGTINNAPYQAALQVPAGANPGDTLTITAQATDEAGNTQMATRGVQVSADGVVVGQVLSDVTSFPVQGATVQAISKTSSSDQTDDHGRYTLQVSDSHLFLSASSATTTTVEREVFVQDNVGTVPVDARLTPLAASVAIGSAGGVLTAGKTTITVPAGMVGDGTTFQLTPLTGQGLPGLLPLGWSPIAAFDLRASSSATNLSGVVAQAQNNIVLHLVVYNPALHAWTLVAPNLQAVSGNINVALPNPGAYALVVPDGATPPITVPDAGGPLTGITMQLLDPSASSTGSSSPAILPPSGGTATANLGVQSAVFVPSGTVIQARISEKFSLKSGDVVSEENRSEDIVLYNALAPANASLGAQFAITPSRKFANAELLTGKVHLDILAGREGVRGQPGGSDPLTLTDGVATLSVPGGALSQDTAISVYSIPLEDFIPTNGTLSALQEILVDFSGETLNTSGQLSIPAAGLNPADTFLLTQVQRIDGVPRLVLIALANINGANLTSAASPGLPGVLTGGEYVFYDVASATPAGFVQGIVSSSAGPVPVLVQTDSLPIVDITGPDGRYIVPAIAGTSNLKVSSPHTNLSGSASVQVAAGQTTQANVLLAGSVTNAAVSPADGALGVPPSTVITITTTTPLKPESISQANLVLKQTASGTPVPLRPFVLSISGTVLSFAPVKNLDPATQYTIQVAGLADIFEVAVVVPVSSFTSKAVAPLNFDPNAITFSFPDASGNIHVSAPAGSLPPGSTVLIVDASNGFVLSLTAGNDGSLSGSMQATINDLLRITVTNPLGASTSFERSQFVAADGTTAIGPGGGTVTGSGGVELRIPSGAVEESSTFKINAFGPDAFTDHPQFAPGAVAAGGIHVSFDGVTPFKQEARLAFPKPAGAPDNAMYFVFRRLHSVSGDIVYEIIDEASVEGTGDAAKVVTHSPPYRGFMNFTNAFNTLTNTVDLTPGRLQSQADFMIEYVQAVVNSFRIQSGVITGIVRQAQPPAVGATEPTFKLVENATVMGADDPQLVDPNTKKTVTTTGLHGEFVLWDPNYGGGTRRLLVTAQDGSQSITVAASEIIPGDDISVIPDIIRVALGPFFQGYRNVAYVNATLPAVPPKPSAPTLQIQLFQPTSSGLQLLNGIAPTETNLTVRVRSTKAGFPNVGVQDLAITGGPTQLAVQPAGNDGAIFLFDATYNTAHQGLFSITAMVLPPLGGNPVTATYDFRAIQGALGGGNDTDDPNHAPTVISTIPRDGEQFVDVRVTPQVFFSEPVTNISSDTVMLTDASGQPIAVQISGVTPNGMLQNGISASSIVTSVLLQPKQLLQYGKVYTLAFSNAIQDTDKDQDGKPAPKNLGTRAPIMFQTQNPEIESRPAADAFPSPGVFVANDTAFLDQVGALYDSGTMVIYDVGNPVQPIDITSSISFPFNPILFPFKRILGRPVAIAGEVNNSFVNNSGQGSNSLIAVAASSYAMARPSNVHLYVDDGKRSGRPKWIGSVSLSNGPQDGMVTSIVVRGDRLYAATWFKGIQVVDLNLVVADVQSAIALNPLFTGLDVLFGTNLGPVNIALYTEGRGFATDAVVNSVPISQTVPCRPDQNSNVGTCNEEFKALIWSIKVSDYVVDGQSATWVIGTGNVQPPSDATPGTNPASVIAVNPLTNEVFRSTPDNGNGIFLFRGTAIALSQIQNPDLPTISNIAVAVGQSSAASSVMFVLDMADPRSPTTLSMTPLDLPNPSDVLVRNNVAAVAFQHVTVFYDISNPKKPLRIGSVGTDDDPVGGKIAFNSDGSLLFSSNFVPGSVGDKSGGLHITEFSSGAYVNFIPPVLATEDKPGEDNSTRSSEVDFNIKTVMVPTSTRVDSAQLQLFKADGSPLQLSRKNDGTPIPTAYSVVLNGTAGTVHFDREALQNAPADLSAQVTYVPHDGQTLTSKKVRFHLGIVKILVDLNNDTVVDDKDRQVQIANAPLSAANDADPKIKRFGFWESDGSKLNISSAPVFSGDPTMQGTLQQVTASAEEDALQDYATLKIHAEALPPSNYTLGILLKSASWALTEKAAGPASCIDPPACTKVDIPQLLRSKEHLSDGTSTINAVAKQLALLNTGSNLCVNRSNSLGAPGECISDSSGFLKLDNLKLGDTVALFRCIHCGITPKTATADPAAPPNGNRAMLAQVLPPTGAPVELDRVDLDVRPIPDWMGLMSAWPQPGAKDTVKNLPPMVLQAVPGWVATPPVSNAHVTVLVHGFNIDISEAQNRWMPGTIKRLYWVGHPVLPVQLDPNDQAPAFTVGVTWNGNIGGAAFGYFYFPDDVFSALQTGAPLAKYLRGLKQSVDPKHPESAPLAQSINVLAHSLGNLAVNSALNQPDTDLSNHAIDVYVMNEPAVPAEAFKTDFTPDPTSAYWQRVGYHAQAYGYSTDPTKVDAEWRQEWAAMAKPICITDREGFVVCQPSFQEDWASIMSAIDTNGAPLPDFQKRWSQGSIGRRSWTGFFAGNPDKTTLYNTWSAEDCVIKYLLPAEALLGVPAYTRGVPIFTVAGQFLQNGAPVGVSSSGLPIWTLGDLTVSEADSNPFWANLWNTDPAQDSLFTGQAGSTHWNTTRQWAELAYWFPSIAGGAGGQRITTLTNADFGSVSAIPSCIQEGANKVSTGSTLSHSYLFAKPGHEAWCALKRVRSMFDPNISDPDPVDASCGQKIPPND